MAEKKSKLAVIKTKPTAASVEDFINHVESEQKRKDSFVLLEMMKKASGEEPVLWSNSIIGFGIKRSDYPFYGKSDIFMKCVISCICFIGGYLDLHQYAPIEFIYKRVGELICPELKDNREAFDEAILFCKKTGVVNDARNGYVFKLWVIHHDFDSDKNMKEIFAIIDGNSGEKPISINQDISEWADSEKINALTKWAADHNTEFKELKAGLHEISTLFETASKKMFDITSLIWIKPEHQEEISKISA